MNIVNPNAIDTSTPEFASALKLAADDVLRLAGPETPTELTAKTVERLMARGVPRLRAVKVFEPTLRLDTKAMRAVAMWLPKLPEILQGTDKSVLLLMGANGTGKSTAAAYALSLQKSGQTPPLKSYTHEDWQPHWMSAASYVEAKYPSSPASEQDKARSHKIRTSSFAVLDDLCYEQNGQTDFGIKAIADFLYFRMDHCYPTIVTSNLDIAQIGRRYTPKLESRLLECAMMIQIDGEDLRRG